MQEIMNPVSILSKKDLQRKYRNPLDGTIRSREAWERVLQFSGLAWADVDLVPVDANPEGADHAE